MIITTLFLWGLTPCRLTNKVVTDVSENRASSETSAPKMKALCSSKTSTTTYLVRADIVREVLTKVQVLWNVTPYRLHDPEDGGTAVVRKVGIYLPVYTA
jgi:hypothetical protein